VSKRNRSGAEQRRARKRRLEREALFGSRSGSVPVHSTHSDPQPRKQQ
jgi:hypothetical protein